MLFLVLFLATILLAYSNGANDNFKGVATLYGSKTLDFKTALRLTTVVTFAGSIASIFLAQALVHHFSGKGLVPDVVAGSPEFLSAVALGAGATVLVATISGFPISTTHSLTGALLGTGFMAVGSAVNLTILGNNFFLPLLVSPLIALLLGASCYFMFHSLRVVSGLSKELCICVGQIESVIPIKAPVSIFTLGTSEIGIQIDSETHCSERYVGEFYGLKLQSLLNFAHCLSGATVCFARGLNDTPKIVALLLTISALDIHFGLLAVGFGMAIGGLLNARKVAETMSNRITKINHGQGFCANLVTGILVIFASRYGMPVSTTHVSVGAIFGIGLLSRQADKALISKILLSWLITLPAAALLSGLTFFFLK